MPTVDCTTGETREFTAEEIHAQQAAAAARQPEEPVGFHFSPREFLEALLTAMVQEGVFTAAKAKAIAARTRNALKR